MDQYHLIHYDASGFWKLDQKKGWGISDDIYEDDHAQHANTSINLNLSI